MTSFLHPTQARSSFTHPLLARVMLALVMLLPLLLGAAFPAARPARAAGVIYVDNDNTSGVYDGASWATAYRRLQNALAVAASGDEVWVAKGVYYPDEGAVQTNNDPETSFLLLNGVALYGGFSGMETELSQRDILAHPTILSGDLDKNDTNADGNFIAETFFSIQGSNAYHVVTGNGTDASAVLDGFIITAGDADFDSSPSEPRSLGGGIYNLSSAPSLRNLRFYGNYAYQGGAMYNSASSPAISEAAFSGNFAEDGGGAIYNKLGSSPSFTDVNIASNLADGSGGGMVNIDSNPSLTRVTFNGNRADHPLYSSGAGGGMENIRSHPSLTDVIFYQNEADQEGGGMANIDSNPFLTRVIFHSNSAPLGGGMNNETSSPTLRDVVFNRNFASSAGGGIHMYQSDSELSRVTFKDNFSSGDGGGMYISVYSDPVLTNVTFNNNQAVDYGGAIFTRGYSSPTLTNVSIIENGASYYGGLYNSDHSTPLLRNTLMGNNAVYECASDPTSGLNGESSHNLIEDAANACGLVDGVNGNRVGVDPVTGPLQNNGGFSETMALLPGSPAIDAGDNAPCPATDQRNISRPADGDSTGTATCDMGAYEAEVLANLAVHLSNNLPGGMAAVGGQFSWRLSVLNNGLQSAAFSAGQVILRDNLPSSGAAYGAPTVQNLVNVANGANLVCGILSNTLTCAAIGGSVTLGAGNGQFEVLIPVTPSAPGALANPQPGGVCRVDPNGLVTESAESNNNCEPDSVIAGMAVYIPLVIR